MVATVSMVLSSPALAEKPVDKKDNGKITTTSKKVKGNGSSSGTTEKVLPDETGNCPDGWVWLELYGFCIII